MTAPIRMPTLTHLADHDLQIPAAGTRVFVEMYHHRGWLIRTYADTLIFSPVSENIKLGTVEKIGKPKISGQPDSRRDVRNARFFVRNTYQHHGD